MNEKNVLWTEHTISEALNVTLSIPVTITSISIDSRTLKPGALFIALQGECHDGHDHIAAAFEQGAVLVVASKPMDDPRVIQVADTQTALEDLAAYKRTHTQATIFGITGSVGKTSTKEMLAAACSAIGKTSFTKGNLNNHIGTPLTLASLQESLEYAVIEMGMNHAKEIHNLTVQAKPNIAIITNVSAVHLEHFDNVEGIARAKAEICDGITPGGTLIVNRDIETYEIIHTIAKEKDVTLITTGETIEADIRLDSYDGKEVIAAYKEDTYGYAIGLEGKHHAINSLAVLAALIAADIPPERIQLALLALGKISAGEGRGKKYTIPTETGYYTLYDDCYNAGPVSVVAALTALGQTTGRKIAVLGDMLELGAASESLHKALLNPIIEHKIDHILTVGSHMESLYNILPDTVRLGHAPTAKAAVPIVSNIIEDNDNVWIKGSNSMKMKSIVEALSASTSHQHKMAN